MTHRRRPNGMSMIELLVALGFFGLVSMCALQIMSFGLQLGVDCRRAADQHRHALTGISRLLLDLQETRAELVAGRLDGPDPVLAMPSPRDAQGRFHRTDHGTPDWQGWVVYYLRPEPGGETRTLVRRLVTGVPYVPGFDPTRLANGEGRPIASGVSAFSATPTVGPNGYPALRLQISVADPTDRTRAVLPVERLAVFPRSEGVALVPTASVASAAGAL